MTSIGPVWYKKTKMNFLLTKQTKTIVIFALTVALLGGVGYSGYQYWQSKQAVPEPPESSVAEEPNPTPITEPTDDPNWNLYINKEYGFSVEYPTGWEVEEKKISKAGAPEYVARNKISFEAVGEGYITIYAMRTDLGLMSWSNKFYELLSSSVGALPSNPNAGLAGRDALIVYSPPNQAPSKVIVALREGSYIFTLEHFTPKNENPLLWDIYEHFVRTFEFENTESIPDKLPTFPMGF